MKSEVLLFSVLIWLIQSLNCFLLDGPTNGGKQTTGNTQFLTETEFLQAKKLLHQNTEELRHDMDKTIAFLTSQLKSKFELLETKLSEVDKETKTNNDSISIEKYFALEQKLTNVEKKLTSVEQKLINVEQKLTNVQRENDQLKQKNAIVENEIISLKNNSSKQVEALQKLTAIKPLQEGNVLRQSVHLNTDKMHALSINEQARSQDFLALYNVTTATGRKLIEMETSTNNSILQLKHNQTMTMNNLKQDFDNQLTSFQTSYNSTIYDLHTKEMSMQKQITENNERVALFAWASDKSGNVIRFNNIRLSVGITNISAFKSTGKFVCGKEGLYLIAATVASNEAYNTFCINQGNTSVSCTEIGQHSGTAWHSGTSVAILHLRVNDEVRVETSHTIETSYWTQFTLVKIK